MGSGKTKFKPYYAVIFTSTQKENVDGYSKMADRMECGEIGLSNDGAVSLFYFLTKQSDRKTELFNHKNITGLTQKLPKTPPR